jgi:uncharacterized protein (DUF3084 family)
MFWTLLALGLMLLLGGFISYYGDLQGRRWGKKRVSILGMRPKHTAVLLTSLTGGVIVLFSIGTVLAVFPVVRDVAQHGEEAIRDNKRLKSENDDLAAKKKEQNVEVEKKNADLIDIKKHYVVAFNALDQASKKNVAMESKNRSLTDHNNALLREQSQLENKRRQLETVNRNLESENRKLVVENANAEIINKDFGRQNTNLMREKIDLEKQNTEQAKANQELEEKNKKLLASNMELQQRKEALEQANDGLQRAYEGLLKANEAETIQHRQDKKDLQREIAQLKQKRDEYAAQLEGTSNNFVQTYLELRQARFTLRADAELARRTLDAHMRPEAVRAELQLLLRDASEKARRYGAVKGENGLTVAIVNKRLFTPASIKTMDEAASLDAIVDNITASNSPVVVVARAFNNSVAGEQAVVELSSYAVGTVFKIGEKVATRQIDARQPVERVVQGIVDFLQKDVRDAAIRAGTIPQINLDTGLEEVGTMGTADLVALTERVRKVGGKVQLTAVAAAPVTAADPLTFAISPDTGPKNLRFEIKRIADRP